MRKQLYLSRVLPQCGGVLLALALSACGGGDSATPATPQAKMMGNVTAVAAVAADYQTVSQQIYLAYFGRPADPSGLVNLEAQLLAAGAPTTIDALGAAYDSNLALRAIIDTFGASTESATLYASNNDAEFVIAVYRHVLGRDPLLAGLSYWATALQSGMPRAKTALTITAAALGNSTSQGQLDTAAIANKTLGATLFTAATTQQAYSTASAAARARDLLAAITASSTEEEIKRIISGDLPVVTPGA